MGKREQQLELFCAHCGLPGLDGTGFFRRLARFFPLAAQGAVLHPLVDYFFDDGTDGLLVVTFAHRHVDRPRVDCSAPLAEINQDKRGRDRDAGLLPSP